jgi:hypothetical protein
MATVLMFWSSAFTGSADSARDRVEKTTQKRE